MNSKDLEAGTIVPYGPSQEKSHDTVTDDVTRPLLLREGGGAAELKNTQVFIILPNLSAKKQRLICTYIVGPEQMRQVVRRTCL